MSKLEKLKDKAKGLEAKDPKSAIEAWLTVLQAQEQDGEPNPDLSVFNRVGDLYLKVKDPARPADHVSEARQAVRGEGIRSRSEAELRRIRRADAEGREDPAGLRRAQGVHRHLSGEHAAPGDVGGAPQDVRRCRAPAVQPGGGARAARGAAPAAGRPLEVREAEDVEPRVPRRRRPSRREGASCGAAAPPASPG